MSRLSLDIARRAAEAALDHATSLGVNVSVVVIDDSGSPKTSSVQDGALLISPGYALKKAYTALVFKAAPDDLPMATGPMDALRVMTADPRLLFVSGGMPLTVDDRVVGAIGVAGGPAAGDRACCEAAVAAVAGPEAGRS